MSESEKGLMMPTPNKIILFYSGSTSGESLPERVLAKAEPGIMLTYWEMRENKGDTLRRFIRHAQRKELQDNAG